MNVTHTVSLCLDDASFEDLQELIKTPEGASHVSVSTSTVARGHGYGEYQAVTLKLSWES